MNNFREGINFIYNEYDNSTVRVKDLKYIYENSKIEIHFHYPITSLRKFFCKEQRLLEYTKCIILLGRLFMKGQVLMKLKHGKFSLCRFYSF